MKSSRRRSREFALQAIYQWLLAGPSLSDLEKQYAAAEGFNRADAGLFSAIVSGVMKHADSLREQLAPHLDRPWPELSPIESAIMLIGAFELVHAPETPYRVIINEGIELAKSFGGTDGHKYVNGILDKLAAQVRAEEIAFQSANPAEAKPRAASKTPTVVTKPRRIAKS
jgi:N utilization substance protein B